MNASESGTTAVSTVGFKRTVAAYVSLTKPRVMELLLAVTIPTMFLAQEGVPNLWLVLAVLIGGMMSADLAVLAQKVEETIRATGASQLGQLS